MKNEDKDELELEDELEDEIPNEDELEDEIPNEDEEPGGESVKDLPVEVEKKTPAKRSAFDFAGAFANIPGVVTGDIGLELQRFPVEKVKFTTTSRGLISIISPQVVALKTHYSDDVGSIICFGGQCCEDMGLPSIRYVFPIVVYDVNKKGIPQSQEIKNMCLSIGKDTYEAIMGIHELEGDISKVDLLVTCTDEGYQKISVSSAGRARWRKSKALAKEVVTFWKEHLKDIVLPIGKVMTEEEYIKKMGSVVTGDDVVSDADLEEMFKD